MWPCLRCEPRYDCYICHGSSPYAADLCVAMADFFRDADKRLQVAVAAQHRGKGTNILAAKSAANYVMLITTGCFKGDVSFPAPLRAMHPKPPPLRAGERTPNHSPLGCVPEPWLPCRRHNVIWNSSVQSQTPRFYLFVV